MARTPQTHGGLSAAGLTIALLLLFAACDGGGGPQDPAPTPTDDLMELLEYVPASYEQHWVCLSAPRRFLDDAGFQDVRTVEEVTAALEDQSLSTEDRDDPLLGPVSVFSAFGRGLAMDATEVRDRLDLDIFQMESHLNVGPDLFDVARLPFDSKALAAVLETQGYGRQEHGGVPYYTIADDFDVAAPVNDQGDKLPVGLAFMMMASMSRVWLQDGTLAVAHATQIMTDVMDAASGRMESVLDRKEYRGTAEGLGPVHAACFLDPAEASFEALFGTLDTSQRLYVLAEVAKYPDWSTLAPPDLVALGYYRRPDGTDVFKVGLWYDDERKAGDNAPELQKRLEQYESTSADKPLCEGVEVHSASSLEGSLALAECRGGLAGRWRSRLLNHELNIFLMESLPDQNDARP